MNLRTLLLNSSLRIGGCVGLKGGYETLVKKTTFYNNLHLATLRPELAQVSASLFPDGNGKIC
jgi:hypothetical protein